MIPLEQVDRLQDDLYSIRRKRQFKEVRDRRNRRRFQSVLTASTPLNHASAIPERTWGMSPVFHSRLFVPPSSSLKELSRGEDSGLGVSICDSSAEGEDLGHVDPFVSLLPQQYDFLKELTKVGGYEVISHLLGYLSPKDLQAVSSVSRHYRNIILNDPQANRRRCEYLNYSRLDNEEKGKKRVVEQKETNEDRVLFQDSTNKLPTVPKQPLENQSPKTKFDYFIEARKKIHKSEVLMKCLKCQYPSRRINGSRFCCTRQFCSYEFCRDCLGTYADNHQCRKFQMMEDLPNIIVGSLKSKKNLRRL